VRLQRIAAVQRSGHAALRLHPAAAIAANRKRRGLDAE
jgi:hypothetical protein